MDVVKSNNKEIRKWLFVLCRLWNAWGWQGREKYDHQQPEMEFYTRALKLWNMSPYIGGCCGYHCTELIIEKTLRLVWHAHSNQTEIVRRTEDCVNYGTCLCAFLCAHRIIPKFELHIIVSWKSMWNSIPYPFYKCSEPKNGHWKRQNVEIFVENGLIGTIWLS